METGMISHKIIGLNMSIAWKGFKKQKASHLIKRVLLFGFKDKRILKNTAKKS